MPVMDQWGIRESGWSPSARPEVENAHGVRSTVMALPSGLGGDDSGPDRFSGGEGAASLATTPFFSPDRCYAAATPSAPVEAVTRWFVRNTRFVFGRLASMLRRPGWALEFRRQPSGQESGEEVRGMRAMSEPVALADYRQSRREQVHKHLRLVEERSMEGMSIAYDRVEQDRPELTLLKAVQAGARQAVFDIGVAHGALIMAGVQVPVELMTAQSEMAGVSNALLGLLERDLAENRDHRAIITALRGDLDGGA